MFARREFVKLAKSLKLKTVSYEGGPGYKVGGEAPGSAGLNKMIESARDPGMKAIVKGHIDACWQWGWDEYNYFAAKNQYSMYGCWGATETYGDLKPGPPKLQALYELTGHSPHERAEWAANRNRPRAQLMSQQ